MWALKRIEDHKYVAKSGRRSSYTTHLQCAQLFLSREVAIQNACIENEYPVNVGDILYGRRRS